FGNHHVNPSLNAVYTFGKRYIHTLSIAGGKRVFQYNPGAISERLNSLYTLLSEANYMKIYEADFFRLGYSTGLGSGLNLAGSFQFQNRRALTNLVDPARWKDVSGREFTPNYPQPNEAGGYMPNHQAAMLTVGVVWRPGADYIEFPDRKISIGSKYPTMTASITKGIHGLFGSDVDYTKWRFGISDELNLKMGGQFNYNITVGGFLDAARTFVPDQQHYLGNQTLFASPSLNGFQLAPYYQYSNTAGFQAVGHAEYHLNGLLSNKIPGFKKLNWFFVGGANMLYTSEGTHYYEGVIGIENILKTIRVDFVQGFEKGGGKPSGFRLTLPIF
ncbi:MAG: CarboxypepD reg-like protein, partial [Sediminibacterium sp.]|nr:CarboxypepD reg-like protein [Sediminibacterium sp.]